MPTHFWEDSGFGRRSTPMGAPVETAAVSPTRERPAWKALETHYQTISKLHLRNLFADDSKRGERMTAEGAGIYLDYSKNRITDKTLKLLVELAHESGLRERTDAM